jgi:hypothetical protein
MYPKGPKSKETGESNQVQSVGKEKVAKKEAKPDNKVIGGSLLGMMLARTTKLIRKQSAERKPSVGVGRLHGHLMVAHTWARAQLKAVSGVDREAKEAEVVERLGGPMPQEFSLDDHVAKVSLILSQMVADGSIAADREHHGRETDVDKINKVIQWVRRGTPESDTPDIVKHVLGSAADPENSLWETRTPHEAKDFSAARSAAKEARKKRKEEEPKAPPQDAEAAQAGSGKDAKHPPKPTSAAAPTRPGQPKASPGPGKAGRPAPKRTRSAARAADQSPKKPKGSSKSPIPNQKMDQD